jgi:hypothetical protein
MKFYHFFFKYSYYPLCIRLLCLQKAIGFWVNLLGKKESIKVMPY